MASGTIPSQLNDRAQKGFVKSDLYDQHRPAYSASVVQYLLGQLRVAGKKNATVVDLAAGTGKFTEALAGREEDFRIIAVEPHAQMRKVLEAKGLRGVTVVDGTSDCMPNLQDGSVDAVIVAQSFHWFANMASLREIHRVLRQHGALGLIWNVDSFNSPRDYKALTSWEAKVHQLNWDVAEEVQDVEPRFRHMRWKEVFDEQVKKTPLSLLIASGDQMFSLPIAEHIEHYEVTMSSEDVFKRFATLGHIAALDEDLITKTRKTLMSAIDAAEGERDGSENVTLHGQTHAYWTTKIPESGRESLTGVSRPEQDRTDNPDDDSLYR